MNRRLAFALVVVAGCSDHTTVPDLGDAGARDLGTTVDLTTTNHPTDMTTGPDFSAQDFAGLPDLSNTVVDQAPAPDLNTPDLAMPDLVPPADMAKGLFAGATSNLIGMGAGPFYVVARDVSNDSKLDLVVADYATGQVGVLLGKGDGTFGAPALFQAGALANGQTSTFPKVLVIADFNKDGKLDLAISNINGVALLTGNNDGTFNAPGTTTAAGTRTRTVVAADFNADGNLDVAVSNNGDNDVSVLQGDGKGGFAAAINFAVGALPVGIATGDFNGDGKVDLAVNCANNNMGGNIGVVAVLLNGGVVAGNVTFKTSTLFNEGSNAQYGIAAADIDGDSKLDLLVSNNADNSLSFLKGDGAGSFAAQVVTANVGDSPNSIALADFNGDGHTDVALANAGGSDVSILTGAGDGTFSAPLHSAAGMVPQSVSAGDFNGDKKIDLAVANYGSHDVSVLLNNF